MNTVMIEEMSWPKFREAMSSSDLVIIPAGSAESHCPHNPLGTDSYISIEGPGQQQAQKE